MTSRVESLLKVNVSYSNNVWFINSICPIIMTRKQIIVTVDLFERNPCCWSEIKPCRLQYCRISAEMTRSITLQNTEVKAIGRY